MSNILSEGAGFDNDYLRVIHAGECTTEKGLSKFRTDIETIASNTTYKLQVKSDMQVPQTSKGHMQGKDDRIL